MTKFKTIVLAGTLALLSAPAMASSCPKDMAAVDAALAKGPMLSEQQMSQVKMLRAEGEQLHKSGKHADSVAKLHEAKVILGIQ